MTTVIKSLIVDEKNSSYVRDDYANDRLYKIYYDSKSKNYFWKSNEGVDIASDNTVLNMKYNHIPDAIYHKNNKKLNKILKNYSYEEVEKLVNGYYDEVFLYPYKKDGYSNHSREDFYRKDVYVKSNSLGKKIGKFISVLVRTGINLGIFVGFLAFLNPIWNKSLELFGVESTKELIQNVVAIIENANLNEEPTEIEIKLEAIKEPELKDTYNYDIIKNAIESNPNLTDIEKSFLYELRFVFDENHQYMDLDMIISRLKTLRIDYINETSKGNFGGCYYRSDNYIECYNNSTSFEDVDISIFLHEFFHVLQQPSKNNLTKELSNELFTREAVRRLHMRGVLDKFGKKIGMNHLKIYRYGEGYEAWIEIYYKLAEIVSQQTLCRFQFEGNENRLADGLTKHDTDYNIQYTIQKAWNLIEMINNSRNEDFLLLRPTKIIDDINDNINYFYQLCNTSIDENITNNLSHFMTFDNLTAEFLLEILGKSEYLEYDDCIMIYTGAQMKTYFSDEFKETTIHIEFDGRGQNRNQGIEILKANGDYNKTYFIVVNDDLKEKYSNYVTQNYNNGISK